MNRKESDVGIKYKNGNAYSTVCPYDVDDVYVTFSSVNPATRWPGTTWTLVTAGTFLVAGASSGTYEVGNTGGEAAHVITNGEMPSHNHIWYLGGKERVGYDISGSAGSFVAGLASKTATSGDAITIGSTGGGAAHNNMPPYIACYMWRRTGGGHLADLKFKDGSKFTSLLDLVFPIGSTYMSMGSASPGTLFGGTWSKVTGGVLALAGTSGYAAAGSTGGSKKIGIAQMPPHTHKYHGYNSEAGTTTLRGSYPPWIAQDKKYNWDMDACIATGGGADYYPLHVSVNVWERTA